MENTIYAERRIATIRWIKVRYGWILKDGISLILITALLCLALYLPQNNDANLPRSEEVNQPVTETINPPNIASVTVTAIPAYNPNTKTPDN